MHKLSSVDRLISKCKTWRSFTEITNQFDNSLKGDLFERLSQLYLQTRAEYRTKFKHVWVCKWDLPPKVRRQLGLPASDEGIDLVAETTDGKYWAIQCKYRENQDKALALSELTTFTNLTFNARNGVFDQALIIHTASRPVRKRKLLGTRTVEIGLERWLELGEEDWKLIRERLKGQATRPKPRKPRPHQSKAIQAARDYFLKKKASRGKLIMPCGTGKSLTAFWIAKELKARLLLVAVPSLSLIKQNVEEWTREIVASDEHPLPEWLCICSDESAGAIDRDEFVGGVYDLGLDVTTDPDRIRSFLKKTTKARRIVFVTYQSSPLLAKIAKKAGIQFDVAILDEAHKTAGAKSKSFATLLFDKNVSISKRVFMTATERVTRGSHDEIVSMDRRADYGDVFFQLSFKDAIHSSPPIISDYKVLTVLVLDEEIKRIIRDRRLLTDKRFGIEEKDARELAVGLALQKAFAEHEIKHAISFHRSINSAKEFQSQQSALVDAKLLKPPFESLHISSKNSAGERAVLLQEFAASDRALLTNARCLTEGVDIPAIDCVLFADPKQSTIDIVQASGRALRPYPGKRFGYIMVPLVVPEGMSFEAFSETTNFRQVSRVIASLSTQDERIAEEYRVVDRAKNSSDRIINIVSTVPFGENVELEKLAVSISTKIWQRIGPLNWRPFENARQFARELNLVSVREWLTFCGSANRPDDIPVSPQDVYFDKGWVNWGDWLGTGTIALRNREYRTFEEARSYVKKLGLRNREEWSNFCKSGCKPEDIPTAPEQVYKHAGWAGVGDWLGTGCIATQKLTFRSFNNARRFVQSLNLKNVEAWKEFCRLGKRPKDIPYSPDKTYKSSGWLNWGNWLGTETISNQNRTYLEFNAARLFARSLKLKNRDEWREFCNSGNKPVDIPSDPGRTYKTSGWQGIGDWLGTGAVASQHREFRSFKKARCFVRNQMLKSQEDWRSFCRSGKKPDDIPANPDSTYRDRGWAGFGDWLGTGSIAPGTRVYRSFEDARRFARSLKLSSRRDWLKYCESGDRPDDIPTNPNQFYRDNGWAGMGDWLGTGAIAPQLRTYRPFANARKFARKLKLKNQDAWRAFCKSGALPADIPANPMQVYKDDGWLGMGDWLGTGNIAPRNLTYRPFEEARDFARGLKLLNKTQWIEFCRSGKKPTDIPTSPDKTYKHKGWQGMGDWLGTGTIASQNREFRKFVEARSFARTQNLRSSSEWRAFCRAGRKPKDIPACPNETYQNNGWISWMDWLGTDK